MKKYKFNEINKDNIQIYGGVNGFMIRNNNGIENVNHYDFYYKYFDSKKRLIKVSGVCKNLNHLKEKLEKELNQN